MVIITTSWTEKKNHLQIDGVVGETTQLILMSLPGIYKTNKITYALMFILKRTGNTNTIAYYGPLKIFWTT